MRQRIASHEQTLRNPNISAGTAVVTRVKLFFRYLQYAVVHAFSLLFLHPSKSFVAIYNPRPDGVWQRSYVEHVAYRNRVRFASASGLGVLVTAAVASYTIFGLVFPDRGISPVYATSITVNSINDEDDGSCDATHCSLREAIIAANSSMGADTITFSSIMAIMPTSVLPSLTDNNTTIIGGGAVIDGTNAGARVNGLNVFADACLIAGMIIRNYGGNGISVQSTVDNVVIGGLGLDANSIYGNGEVGISILGGASHQIYGNFIGATAAGVVDENTLGGISLNGTTSSTQIGDENSTNYIVDGVLIGENVTGTTLYGNVIGVSTSGESGSAMGFSIQGRSTVVGGTEDGQRNVIAGLPTYGIWLTSTALETTIQGNYIGLLSDGSTVDGNDFSGIFVDGAMATTIDSNTIVGNGGDGIEADTALMSLDITNNTIGISPASESAGGNATAGIEVYSSTATTTIDENIIGNNGTSGILLTDSAAEVTGNYVGVTSGGTAVDNTDSGVNLEGAMTGTVVGGSEANRNYIGYNGIGVVTQADVSGNPEISYNYIGVGADGDSGVGNGLGVLLQGQASVVSNVISGNGGGNVQLTGDNNLVSGNIIGLNAAGDTAQDSQSSYGINVITPSSNNTIGAPGLPNIVAGNPASQINIDEGTSGNTVGYNYLNCNLYCTTLIDVGSDAIRLHGASSTMVADNYMGGGSDTAIVLVDPGDNATTENIFTGNFIGVGTDGSDISGDTPYGIYVYGSDVNTIGTTDDGNTIAHFTAGIVVNDSQQINIRGNTFEDNETNISLLNNANGGIQPPAITAVSTTSVDGTSQAAGIVDIYQDGIWVGSVASDGEWTFGGSFDTGLVTSATLTDADGNTSIFYEFAGDNDLEAPVSSALPAGGTYSGTQSVVLTVTDNADSSPQIFYTLDGSTPSTDSTEYSSAILIPADTTLKFFAVDSANNQETVHTEIYDITQDQSGTFSNDKVGVILNGGVTHPECTSCAIRTSDVTPTFIGQVKQALIDYIVRLVIFAVSNTDGGATELEKVFTKEKQITVDPSDSSLGFWKITVPDSQPLNLGEYIVKLGLKDESGNVVKPVHKGLTVAVTPPAPVAVSPLNLVYTKTPDFIGNALNGTTVIARVKKDGTEIAHCSVVVTNSSTGTGSYACKLPFDLPAGEYLSSVSTQDPASGMISDGSEVAFTISSPVPLSDNTPLSLVPGEASIKGKFLTTDNTPVFIGLAPNDTEVVLVIDGTKLFSSKLTNDSSGTGHWRATTSYLTEGVHSAYAVVRAGGEERSRTATMTFKIVAPTVIPIIISPISGAHIVAGTSLSFVVLGHETDTITLTLTGSTTISVTGKVSNDPSGIGRALFTFDNGLPRGSWSVSAVATDSISKPSVASTTVDFTVYTPTPTPSTGTSEGNTNGGTNENENENVNIIINDNGDTNTNSGNTNTFSNENEVIGGLNGNQNVNNGTNENTNQPPTTTEPDRTPLPPTTPAFSFPEGVEKFPIYTKTPGDLTSDQEKAVRVVLNTYLKEELQILPSTQEEDTTYLITNTTADNQPILIATQSVGLGGSAQLTAATNAVRRLFSLSEFKQTKDVLIFRGTTIPYALVQLTIYSDPIVKIAQADQDGHWTMTVPAASLPPGEHTAYLKTSYADAASDEVQIARFVVVQQEHLSNTTWLFIINLAVILVILLAAIFLQLRKRTQLLAAQQTPIPGVAPWKSDPVKDKKPKGPNDLGDVMGV